MKIIFLYSKAFKLVPKPKVDSKNLIYGMLFQLSKM